MHLHLHLHLFLLITILFLLSLIETTAAKKHSRRHPHPKPAPHKHPKHPHLKKIISGLYNDQPGTATWFEQDSEGSCGHWSKDGDLIVALAEAGNGNKYCGKTVVLTYKSKTIRAIVADSCPGCEPRHVDLSKGAFSALTNGNMDLGQVNIHWHIER